MREPEWSWIISPQSSSVLIGGSLTLGCRAGTSSDVKTSWFRNGLTTQVSENYWTFDSHLYAVVGEDDGEFNLQIKNASIIDNTTFTCGNVAASPQSKTVSVNVIIPFPSVEITPNGSDAYSCDAHDGNPAAIRMKWYINGVNVSSAEPWSTATADGKFSSRSLCEVDHSRYHGNVSLTCEVIQSDHVKSITQTVFLKVPAGANRPGATLVLMTVTMTITLVLTQSFRLR
ncbi:kin of IRRE-like protein 1 [Ptychodera flava]|uniref:kin of IRRE-like protein 1 n=1 Tax=Ptychodera flava TaxID=63121 RepID=UPI00396A2C61